MTHARDGEHNERVLRKQRADGHVTLVALVASRTGHRHLHTTQLSQERAL
jgi:hypothetical protein